MAKGRILVIDDEADLIELVRYNLEQEGFQVSSASDGESGLNTAMQEMPDLVLIDLMLPGMDGLEVCRSLHADNRTASIPVIMLTAKSAESDRIVGLELGADDYVVKPFTPREVVARVRAVLRRVSGPLADVDVVRTGDLLIDTAAYRAWMADQPLSLTQSEFEILLALTRHAGHVLKRIQLLEETQGIAYEGYERSIDQHIKNLRRKINKAGGQSDLIQTVYGVGYRLEAAGGPSGKKNVS